MWLSHLFLMCFRTCLSDHQGPLHCLVYPVYPQYISKLERCG